MSDVPPALRGCTTTYTAEVGLARSTGVTDETKLLSIIGPLTSRAPGLGFQSILP